MTKGSQPKGRKGAPTTKGAQAAGHAKKMAKASGGKHAKTKHAIMQAGKIKHQKIQMTGAMGRKLNAQLGKKSGKNIKKERALAAAYERRRGDPHPQSVFENIMLPLSHALRFYNTAEKQALAAAAEAEGDISGDNKSDIGVCKPA
jgi:hypothetical protein